MKKIVLISLISFVTTTAKAQITFEFAQDSASSLGVQIGGSYATDQLMIVNFEVSGEQYVKINRHGKNITIYNMNHALVKTISLAGLPINSVGLPYVLYLSETLFNTDSKKEFMYAVALPNNFYTGIYNEDGVVLFSDSAYPAVVSTYAMQQYPIYNTTSNGTKMMLSYQNGQVKVFDLGGTLSCSSPCSATSTTGLRSVNTTNSNALGNAYPNPTVNSTTIPYALPSGSNQGEIVFYNIQGSEIKRFKVDNTFNSLLVSTSDILAGTYYYQLIINGNVSASKKMIVIK